MTWLLAGVYVLVGLIIGYQVARESYRHDALLHGSTGWALWLWFLTTFTWPLWLLLNLAWVVLDSKPWRGLGDRLFGGE